VPTRIQGELAEHLVIVEKPDLEKIALFEH
jgi:hypothetical protein